MTDNLDSWPEPTPEESAAIGRLLGDPAIWARPSDDVGDRVLASIMAERAESEAAPSDSVENQWPPPGARASTAPAPPTSTPPHREHEHAGSDVVELPTRTDRSRRSRRGRWLPLAAAAAVAVIALGALAAVNLRATDTSTEVQTVALAPTELATEGTVVAEVAELQNGVRIVLDLNGLPPAPEGYFYQAWLVRPEPRNAVSAGTFHLRGGDGSIELWAGVSTEEYTTLSVTLSPESDPTSPGDRLFTGQL